MSTTNPSESVPRGPIQWDDGVRGYHHTAPLESVEWSGAGAGANGVDQCPEALFPEMIINGEYYTKYGVVFALDKALAKGRLPNTALLQGGTRESGQYVLHVGDYLPGFGAPIESILVRDTSSTPSNAAVHNHPRSNPFDDAYKKIIKNHGERYPK